MEFIDYSCKAFVEATASADPVPGGGSVSALVGALGAALGSMVGHLTPLEKMEEEDAKAAEEETSGTEEDKPAEAENTPHRYIHFPKGHP